MNTYKLYLHTFPNGKHYVGITSAKDPNKRWGNGGIRYNKNQPLMYRAIQKYGWENVQHDILLEGLTRKEACERERFYISLFRSNDPKYGYNMTAGGEGVDKGKNWGSKEYMKAMNEKLKPYYRQWYQDNKEKDDARHKAWREANPGKSREMRLKWKERNPEKTKEYSKKYYETHKEQCMEYDRKYKEEHREEINAKWRERYWKKKNSIKQTA